MTGLRAASLGVPFEPLPGLKGTDLPATAGFRTVKDPWSGEDVYVVPALRPRWAVLHVQEADARGNARIYGSPGYDLLMAQAADRIILTAERIVTTEEMARIPELTKISDLTVAAVVELPGGARPGGCAGCYEPDEAGVRRYLEAARTPEGLAAYLASETP
jgi:glutaconate CoA-transferase subunit A